MRYTLYREQQLNCDVFTAWKFFSSAHNLARITPPDLNFKVLSDSDKSIFEGMEINYHVSPFLGIPLKWKTRITQVDEGKSFTDFQEKGPYSFWNHYHEFIPNEKGVFMKDTVHYELPFGFLGSLTHQWVVKGKLNYIFNFRRTFLDQHFNAREYINDIGL